MAVDTADEERPLEQVVAGAVTALTLAVGFGLLALGVPYFWVAFPVGFGGVMPMAVGLARYYDQREDDSETTAGEDDALATLRERYARGELTDAEFERQVEQLLETEDVEAPPGVDGPRAPERERESE